ncbi:hypothetical protein BDN70DRAFT_414322 [Pholiota conissans]|uniref:Uncharacterized protein n=1 Tax=Pholiota conissans TaxID=109636 RepID=A0A9P5YPI2_9AGAR|nr:hypothetical protein BDN70DRAFT_414322 [Pholiota conissans]
MNATQLSETLITPLHPCTIVSFDPAGIIIIIIILPHLISSSSSSQLPCTTNHTPHTHPSKPPCISLRSAKSVLFFLLYISLLVRAIVIFFFFSLYIEVS